MPTSKPHPYSTESTDAEVFAALRALASIDRRVSELVCRETGGWYVLSYRLLWGEPEADGRILVTRSFERYAQLFGSLYQERRLNGAPRKPAGAATKLHEPTGRTERTDRKRVGRRAAAVDPRQLARA